MAGRNSAVAVGRQMRCYCWCGSGRGGPLVERDLAGVVPVDRGTTFEDVVARARRAARPGDVVLLSPACSSYVMVRNYEERGAAFRHLVESLWAKPPQPDDRPPVGNGLA